MARLSDSKVTPVPRDNNANDSNPMWVGSRVYFLSDRGGSVTLYSYDTETKQTKRLVDNRGFDLKSASAGPGGIVYEQLGALYLYDFANERSAAVPVKLRATWPKFSRTSLMSRKSSGTRTCRPAACARCSRRAARS